jgi:hypothetical protein
MKAAANSSNVNKVSQSIGAGPGISVTVHKLTA